MRLQSLTLPARTRPPPGSPLLPDRKLSHVRNRGATRSQVPEQRAGRRLNRLSLIPLLFALVHAARAETKLLSPVNQWQQRRRVPKSVFAGRCLLNTCVMQSKYLR